jgi:hypothetical protein
VTSPPLPLSPATLNLPPTPLCVYNVYSLSPG